MKNEKTIQGKTSKIVRQIKPSHFSITMFLSRLPIFEQVLKAVNRFFKEEFDKILLPKV